MKILVKILAVLTAIFVGHWIVKLAVEHIENENSRRDDKKLAAWLGGLERGMCTTAWFLGFPEFVGLRLGLKVVGSWGEEKGSRGRLSLVLFGTGLSISIAIVIAIITEWILANNFR